MLKFIAHKRARGYIDGEEAERRKNNIIIIIIIGDVYNSISDSI